MLRILSKCFVAGWLLLTTSLILQAQEVGQAGAAAEQPPPPPVGQVVYRSVDKDGQVVFTDQRPSDRPSEEVLVKPANSTSMPVATGAEVPHEKAHREVYTSLVVTSPENDAYFGQEVTVVTLRAMLEPGLQPGDSAQLFYDGKPVEEEGLSYTVSDLERGTHTVRAKVFDENKKVLIVSDPVQFHVRRMSQLNGWNRANKPNPAGGGTIPPGGGNPPAPPMGGFGSFLGAGSPAGGSNGGAVGAGSPRSVPTPK